MHKIKHFLYKLIKEFAESSIFRSIFLGSEVLLIIACLRFWLKISFKKFCMKLDQIDKNMKIFLKVFKKKFKI